jgi:hypothetical protein
VLLTAFSGTAPRLRLVVSGNKSKSTRNKSKPVVVQRSTPWGLIAGIGAVVLIAVVVFGGVALSTAPQRALQAYAPTAENPDPSTAIPGVTVVEYAGGQHVSPAEQVAYTNSPPFGGSHDAIWAACDGVVYDTAVRSENLVHSLEHGAVWITYDPERVSGPALDTLREKVDGENYMVMSPYPGLDQPISLQSWGHQLKLTDVNDPRIDQFITALRINRNTHPEFGASCDEVGAANGFDRTAPPPFVPAPAPGTPGSQAEVADGSAVAPDPVPAPGS